MILSADERLVVPASRTFDNWLMIQHHLIDARLTAELASAKGVAFTCDYWTKYNRRFLGITAHYTTTVQPEFQAVHQYQQQWCLKRCFLALVPMPQSHSAAETAHVVMAAVTGKLGITKSKVVAMTTDNGSNVKKFARESSFFRWVSCFAHSLQLFVRSGLESPGASTSNLFAKVRALSDSFKNTPSYDVRLREACAEKSIKFVRCVVECATRWNSFLFMARKLLLMKNAIRAVFCTWAEQEPSLSVSLERQDLSATQWMELVAIVELLEIFEVMTVNVQSSAKPTISLIVFCLELIRSQVLPAKEEDCVTISCMRTTWRGVFDSRFAPYFDEG
jgi:hypothetical protein